MTTLRYRLFERLALLTGSRGIIGKTVRTGKSRNATPPGALQSRFQRSNVEGRAVWTIHPRSGPSERLYIHHHGGAFVLGLNAVHFATMAKLCDMSGVSICLPDYPYAPAVTVEGATAWALAQFEAAATAHGVENIILGGDSAGANLALVTAMLRRDAGLAQPDGLLLMSPWVDLEMASPHNQAPSTDIFLVTEDLQAAAKIYAGDTNIRDPRVSPTFGALAGLAPMHVFTGELDRLHADIMAFAAKAQAANSLTKLAVYGEFGHIWMFYPTPDRESTLVEMAAILRG